MLRTSSVLGASVGVSVTNILNTVIAQVATL